jgi:hypothetical protein
MSYDLAVWHESRPISNEEAHEIYVRLCDDDRSDVRPHPNVRAFMNELTERYPQIDDCDEDEVENCPWTVAFDHSDGHVGMCIAWPRLKEIVPIVEELAQEHDLICHDPQGPLVHWPPSVARLPHMRLSLEDGQVIDHPSPLSIASALTSLKFDGNSFAILERTDATYLQTSMQSSDEFIIEYQDGSLDKHFRASAFDLSDVTDAFKAYAVQNESWITQFDWQRIEL